VGTKVAFTIRINILKENTYLYLMLNNLASSNTYEHLNFQSQFLPSKSKSKSSFSFKLSVYLEYFIIIVV
jgi:hypothetical protein